MKDYRKLNSLKYHDVLLASESVELPPAYKEDKDRTILEFISKVHFGLRRVPPRSQNLTSITVDSIFHFKSAFLLERATAASNLHFYVTVIPPQIPMFLRKLAFSRCTQQETQLLKCYLEMCNIC